MKPSLFHGRLTILALVQVLVMLGTPARCAETTADFARDPEWESHRSKLLPEPIPVIRQDFGWSATKRAGGKSPGEIGGWVQRSTTPATYAKVIPVRTFNDRLTASGKFTVTHDEGGSGMLFGWFNENSRGWRTPNSLTFRIDGNGGKYWVFFEYGTRSWLTHGGATFEGRYQTTKTKPFLSNGTTHTWSLEYDPNGAGGKGSMTFVIDGSSYTEAFAEGHKADGAEFNRFGIINQQLTGDGMEVYFSDLVLDGQPLDLGRDPGWESRGSRVKFPDRTRRPFHDFGWLPTNKAGGAGKGEIGGVIWRDVKPAYYAAKTRPLTLEQPLKASGVIAFNGAGSDSGAYFGWFDSQAKINNKANEEHINGWSVLGVAIEGPSRVGHYFRPEFRTATSTGASAESGPLIRPDGTKHRWELRYNPVGEGGEISVTFDDQVQKLAVSPEQRKIGATFDRFGIFNLQTGGHYVDFALDDILFTSSQ